MNKIFKKLALTVIIALGLGSVFTGCGANEDDSKINEQATPKPAAENVEDLDEEPKLSGHISIVGSTSVQPLAQLLADAFTDIETEVVIDVQGVGSSAGIKAANDESADIGMASRELKEEEKEWGITEIPIAVDGIAVILNPNNSVTELSLEQITQIYKGEITNWKDVGGEDKEIIVVSREDGSGTRGAYDEIIGIKGELVEDALIQDGNGPVRAKVMTTEEAIGYISLGYVDDSVKVLKVDGFEPSEEKIKSGDYPVSRRLLMLTKGEVAPEVQAYLDFIFSREGNEIVSKDYIPMD
ncbi:phosphate ABC transporter substrate-binding protein [Herbivorax sp. ANBcel31]|uniref:phosphate ABC transporter substrate-binding protein n=1 Tax=Herbivorax sp. ANBcel31 TaxID=3069754 RepID=UPI0027B7764C|nr:phosphate ABC transporter substrate-binding protein [Herbivorax sp. ANBcel31]MDQ2086732.1 phosphate ABC transporter substrate-binding protein [Herbivorax sp. ANBcel31]